MFLSTHENKLDKKWRVSVPASFRSYLNSLGYNGVVCYPSFNNSSIEGCSQKRIERLSDSIDSLNPFEENQIIGKKLKKNLSKEEIINCKNTK